MLVILLTLVCFYVVLIILMRLISFDEDADELNNDRGYFQQSRRRDGVKVVKWKTEYWLPDSGPDVEDYEDVAVSNIDSPLLDAVRVWAYKGLKSEILSLKRSVKDTRPIE